MLDPSGGIQNFSRKESDRFREFHLPAKLSQTSPYMLILITVISELANALKFTE